MTGADTVWALAGWFTMSMLMAGTWSFLYRQKRRRQVERDAEAISRAYLAALEARRRALQGGGDDAR